MLASDNMVPENRTACLILQIIFYFLDTLVFVFFKGAVSRFLAFPMNLHFLLGHTPWFSMSSLTCIQEMVVMLFFLVRKDDDVTENPTIKARQ